MKTEPMNPDVKAKWLEALRSGEYQQQTDGFLRTRSDGYCCLGVLSQIASDEGVVPQPKESNGAYLWTSDDGNSKMYLLPEVMDWAGLDSHSGCINTTDDNNISLSQKNDEGVRFSEIADLIEQCL